ncbi:MAG: response regulator transcription factor [Anaerolineales bacterium]|nr:response regulator transcription factor [Anaerolineales bacterium]
MSEDKHTILIVEDDLDVADMLNAYFRVQGYNVLAVNWGEDGVRTCNTARPDLVILDIRLPDIDGYEVAQRLRSNRRTRDIPIIFLTEQRGREDRLKGLEIGGDDYITKPFDIQELRLRVRNALRRESQGTLTNPVTGLPEGILVDERLSELADEDGWALLLVSLKNLEIFREAYGFVASDDVLRAVSVMIQHALRESGTARDFLGHLTATDFILVLEDAESVAEISERTSTRLEQSLDYFYPIKDRDKKAKDPNRDLSIQMCSLDASAGPFQDIDELKTTLVRNCNQ